MARMNGASLEQMERRFYANYNIQEKVGEGAFGTVHKADCLRTSRKVAIKSMEFNADEEGVPSAAIREIALLKELDHAHVVKLLEVFVSTAKVLLVFNFVETDLKKHMRELGRALLPSEVKRFAFQLCCGIQFCHQHRILHRDLKPQNLLVDSEGCLQVADFGLARQYTVPTPKYTGDVVTVWYRAPEILLSSCFYSIPVDLWSIGCVIGEMAIGSPLFDGDSEIGTIFKIFQYLGTPTEKQWPGVTHLPEFKSTFPRWPGKKLDSIPSMRAQLGAVGVSLLAQIIVYDPNQRLSVRKSIEHAYFADVPAACRQRAASGLANEAALTQGAASFRDANVGK